MLTLLILLGCPSETPAPPAAPEPDAVPEGPAESQAKTRYVLASRLNLRASPGGTKVGRLSINTPLQVLETQGEDVKVRVANGKEGWVPATYLVEEPLTATSAMTASSQAADAEERLSWAQRAAALDGRDKQVLLALAAAYREVGREGLAKKVAAQAEWPDDLLLAGAHRERDGKLVLEWTWHFHDESPFKTEQVSLTEAQMSRLGVTRGESVWVLPSQSPAVQGTISGMRHHTFNECGGTYGLTLEVDVALPDGETAVAYTIKEPPASWQQPARSIDEAQVADAVKAKLPAGDYQLHMAAYGDGARVRAARQTADLATAEMPEYELLDFQVGPDGSATQLDPLDPYRSYIGYPFPAAGRDLDGDGNEDLVLGGICRQALLDHKGDQRLETMGLCCGC